MSLLKPFKAWIPSKEYAPLVAARSSGYENNDVIIQILQENPLCYLHAVKPYLHFGTTVKIPSLHFSHGANYIQQLKEQGVIVQEEKQGFYLYKQTHVSTGEVFAGIIGLCDKQGYLSGKIKLHEKTLTEKENMLIEHIKYTKMSGEPVLVMHKHNADLKAYLSQFYKKEPEIVFEVEGIVHELRLVNDEKALEYLSSKLAESPEMYLADGHHRSAALTRYILESKSTSAGFMALLMFMDDLSVQPFHRLVQCDTSDLIQALASSGFEVNESNEVIAPSHKRNFGLYMNNQWYALVYKKMEHNDLFLDVEIVEKEILKSICGILDSKEDQRVSFFEGNKPITQAVKMIDAKEFDVLITLKECDLDDVCKIADAGMTMPPKSTYILPKLLTGLTIHQLD